jgi:hypothetical protein
MNLIKSIKSINQYNESQQTLSVSVWHLMWEPYIIPISGLTQIESSSGASGSTKGGAYFIKPASKQYSSSMQQPQQKKSPTGGTSTSSFHQSQLPSNEELNSRCGSRQSLLDSTSHRSHLSVAAAAHQYSNAGCTSNVVPSSGAEENMPNRNNQHPSPGNLNLFVST